jgi:RHS repeat-associated protein
LRRAWACPIRRRRQPHPRELRCRLHPLPGRDGTDHERHRQYHEGSPLLRPERRPHRRPHHHHSATTGHKLSVLLTDHLGTADTSVDIASNQAVTRRAFKPYGVIRGTKPTTWPNKRSYLGAGIDDTTTGLTHIGAREYDQASGRFLSADPIVDMADPLQANGYSYSRNSPVSSSDPSGLMPVFDNSGGGPGPSSPAVKETYTGQPYEKTNTYRTEDEVHRWMYTSGSVAFKLRKLRFDQIVNQHKFSYGKYMHDIDEMNDRSCRAEPGGGRLGCRFVSEWTNDQLEDRLKKALDRIDESWTSKGKASKFGFEDAEFEMALTLALEGKKVVARGNNIGAPGSKGNRKTFDAWVDGKRWEFKDMSTNERKRIAKEIFSADEQGADVAFIKLRTADEAMARSAVLQVVNSTQRQNGLTAIRMQGNGYDFSVTLRK